MPWDPTAGMTKDRLREYYTREIAELRSRLEAASEARDKSYTRAAEAEDALDAERNKEGGSTAQALSDLAFEIECVLTPAQMTASLFDAVREAHRLSGGSEDVKPFLLPWAVSPFSPSAKKKSVDILSGLV